MKSRWLAALAVASLLATVPACQSTEGKEFAVDQREALVARVMASRDALVEAGLQYISLREVLSSVVDFDGDVDATYDRLRIELTRCEDAVEDVHNRIGDVRHAAERLRDEWDETLGGATDPRLHDRAAEVRDRTWAAYTPVIEAMEEVERMMDLVLTSYRNQVMELKHDSTAEAVELIRENMPLLSEEISEVGKDILAAAKKAEAFASAAG